MDRRKEFSKYSVPTRTNAQSDFPAIHNYEAFLERAQKDFEAKMRRPPTASEGSVKFADFERIKTLGTGAFGRVILCKKKKTESYVAIKIMDKAQIVKTKQVEHTLNEKNILMSIRFPFIIWMEEFFKDNSYLYFVMPFVNGGEMFTHLRKFGKFPEELSRFYAAQVCLGLEYLHYLDVVYRDLKPENIMFDTNGFVKITDLGFCKVIRSRTWTLCGTPDYIAPEIILSKGYGKQADWWSYGVLLYEMAAGYAPFYSSDQMKIYEKIVAAKYRFPAHFHSDLRDIIQNFLQVDISKRIGCLKNGTQDIKRHKWFKGTDWMAVLNRRFVPPFIPSCKSPADTSNFDSFDEEPLKVADKEVFPNEFSAF